MVSISKLRKVYGKGMTFSCRSFPTSVAEMVVILIARAKNHGQFGGVVGASLSQMVSFMILFFNGA